jgi:hypothetical protein
VVTDIGIVTTEMGGHGHPVGRAHPFRDCDVAHADLPALEASIAMTTAVMDREGTQRRGFG